MNSLRDVDHFHYFVAEVIDCLDGDPARVWLLERAGRIRVKALPRFGVDFGLEGGLEGLVRVVRAQEVGVWRTKKLAMS